MADILNPGGYNTLFGTQGTPPSPNTPTKKTPKTSTTSSDTGTNPGGLSDEDMLNYALKTGITIEQYNNLNKTQKATIAVAGEVASNIYSTKSTGVTLSDALKLAASDPNIIAKYSDALKLDTQEFTNSLNQVQEASNVDMKNKKIQFENDQKALAEATASAGIAYSGFRGKAQKNLADTESGIITSSRLQTQKSVQDLTTAFEQKYGSNATHPAAAVMNNPITGKPEVVSGALAGGITGTQPIAKNADIRSLGQLNLEADTIPNIK